MANEIRIVITGEDKSNAAMAKAAAGQQKVAEAALAHRKAALAAADADAKLRDAQAEVASVSEKVRAGELQGAEAFAKSDQAARGLERALIGQSEAHHKAAAAAHELGKAQNELQSMFKKTEKAGEGLFGKLEYMGQRAFGLVEKLGNTAISGLQSGLESLGELGPLWIVGIGVAIAALPTIAVAASGAITLALGGALAGLGVMAALQSKEVSQAFTNVANDAKKQAAAWAAPFKPALLAIARGADAVLKDLGTTFTSTFKQMAPVIAQFGLNFESSLSKLKPAISEVGSAFDKILTELGPKLPALMDSIAKGITAFAQAAGDHSTEIVQFILAMGQLVEWTGKATKALAELEPILDPMTSVFAALGDASKTTAAGMASFGAGMASAAAATLPLADTTQKVGDAMQTASLDADAMKASLDALTGKALSAREAAAQYGEAVIAMTKSLKQNGAAHGFATEKGLKNEEALTKLANAAIKNEEAMKADGASTKSVAKAMDDARARVIHAAEGMGYSRKEAEALATKLLGVRNAANKIPTQKRIRVSADVSQAMAAVRAVQNVINSITAPIIGAPRRASGGVIGGYATGGVTRGNSGSTYAMVGESGPEVVRLPYGSTVMSNPDSQHLISSVSGGGRGLGGGAMEAFLPAAPGAVGPNPATLHNPTSRSWDAGGVHYSYLPAAGGGAGASVSASTTSGGGGGGSVNVTVKVQLEWIGTHASDEFLRWLRKNIRIRGGSGSNSVQQALGPG